MGKKDASESHNTGMKKRSVMRKLKEGEGKVPVIFSKKRFGRGSLVVVKEKGEPLAHLSGRGDR